MSAVEVHVARLDPAPGDPGAAGAQDPVHAALLSLVRDVTGAREPRLTHACPRCGAADHGRPVVRGLAPDDTPHISLARATAGTAAAIAVCVTRPVGIDIEADDPATRARAAEALRADVPLRAWVRAEALLKARGTGLAADPLSLRLSPRGGGQYRAAGEAPGRVVDIDLGAGSVAAVAVDVDGTVRVVRH